MARVSCIEVWSSEEGGDRRGEKKKRRGSDCKGKMTALSIHAWFFVISVSLFLTGSLSGVYMYVPQNSLGLVSLSLLSALSLALALSERDRDFARVFYFTRFLTIRPSHSLSVNSHMDTQTHAQRPWPFAGFSCG
jgi:hypothetical protein